MAGDSTKLIEAWFAKHDGDGVFARDPPSAPSTVIGPSGPRVPVIFTTKPRIVALALDQCEVPGEFGMIGRYGLPGAQDIYWIRQLVGLGELLFLGDLDPVELMIFAWLRARVQPTATRHLGISDAFLAQLKVTLPENFLIPFASSEREAMPLLSQVFPDVAAIVCPTCAGILSRGLKIELEAVVSAMGSAATILLAARNAK